LSQTGLVPSGTTCGADLAAYVLPAGGEAQRSRRVIGCEAREPTPATVAAGRVDV